MSDPRRKRPTALITGGSKGIGLALAWEFARHGHDLVLVARDKKALARASAEIESETAVKDSTPHYPGARQPVLQSAIGMNNGIDRRADPQEKQYKSGDESDHFGRFQPLSHEHHWKQQRKPNDRPANKQL